MNWFQRTAQMGGFGGGIEDTIQAVLRNELGVEYGGQAWQTMRRAGPAACEAINGTAGTMGLSGIDPSAVAKMQKLAEAAGCDWNPQAPDDGAVNDPMAAPMQTQEAPMDMPSVEIA